MARGKDYPTRYISSLTKEGKVDFYEKQVAFWRSVCKKYPRPMNKTQLRYMEKNLEELTL